MKKKKDTKCLASARGRERCVGAMASTAATEFVSVTGTDLQTAEHFLALTVAGGDVEAAVGLYFEAVEAHGRAPQPDTPAATAGAGIASSSGMRASLPPSDAGFSDNDGRDAGAAVDAGGAATAAATPDG